MGCGCKTNIGANDSVSIKGNNIIIDGFSSLSKANHKTKKYLRYTLNFGVFLISLILLPIMMLGVIAIMFQVLVINDTLDMGKIAKIVAHKIKFANYDEEELNYIYGEELNHDYEDDDFEYTDVYGIEDIKETNKDVK